MDDETRAELIEQAEAFRAVDEMVKTSGWQKYVIGRIEKFKARNEAILRTSKEYRIMMKAQEALNATDELLSSLMMDIHNGEEAIKKLAQEKDES